MRLPATWRCAGVLPAAVPRGAPRVPAGARGRGHPGGGARGPPRRHQHHRAARAEAPPLLFCQLRKCSQHRHRNRNKTGQRHSCPPPYSTVVLVFKTTPMAPCPRRPVVCGVTCIDYDHVQARRAAARPPPPYACSGAMPVTTLRDQRGHSPHCHTWTLLPRGRQLSFEKNPDLHVCHRSAHLPRHVW